MFSFQFRVLVFFLRRLTTLWMFPFLFLELRKVFVRIISSSFMPGITTHCFEWIMPLSCNLACRTFSCWKKTESTSVSSFLEFRNSSVLKMFHWYLWIKWQLLDHKVDGQQTERSALRLATVDQYRSTLALRLLNEPHDSIDDALLDYILNGLFRPVKSQEGHSLDLRIVLAVLTSAVYYVTYLVQKEPFHVLSWTLATCAVMSSARKMLSVIFIGIDVVLTIATVIDSFYILFNSLTVKSELLIGAIAFIYFFARNTSK